MDIMNNNEKFLLTVSEAAKYFNINENKIRDMTSSNSCPFVLWNGKKRLIKKKIFEDYLNNSYSI